MTETMTETVADDAVAVEANRDPVTVGVHHQAGVIRLAGGSAPNDPALDSLVYLESVNVAAGTVNVYTLNENGETGIYKTRIDNKRVLEIVHGDYYTWQRDTKVARSVGKFASIVRNHLSAELQQSMADAKQEFQRYCTFAEILKVDHGQVTVRVFSTRSETPDAIEYGEMTIPASTLSEFTLMNKARWEMSYGLTKEVWPAGSFRYRDAELFEVVSNNGHMASFARVDESTGERIVADGVNDLVLTREYASSITFAATDKAAYVATLPSAEVVDAIKLLSRNTVTRALKHADSNDYCSETAVALTSAGHAMPELRIKGTVTLNIDFTSKEYMLMRRLFGMANASVTDVQEVFKAHYNDLQRHLSGLPAFTADKNTVWDLTAEVDFKTPKLRPLA